MMNVLRVILSGVAAKDPGQILRVILSEATLVAKSKDLGGPALPRRHALFYGPASRHCHPAVLVKRGQAPLALLAAPVSAPTGHDRCRETLVEAA